MKVLSDPGVGRFQERELRHGGSSKINNNDGSAHQRRGHVRGTRRRQQRQQQREQRARPAEGQHREADRRSANGEREENGRGVQKQGERGRRRGVIPICRGEANLTSTTPPKKN